MKFEELGLNPKLLTIISKMGITEPTEIQEKSIPHIIKGKDIIGESATGSGKTLAFGTGVIEGVKPKSGLQALILTPTRELAEQVKNAIIKFSYKKLNILAIYGGVSIVPQIRYLPNADIVVATPGRLLDHINRRTIDISKLKILVLDEADRMLDMGFVRDVEKIMKNCPRNKQTLFFSATISPRIKSLTTRYMIKPVSISVDNQVDPKKLTQVYYNILQPKKLSLLAQLLEEEKSKLVLVFCNTRRETTFVTKMLLKNDIDAIAVHGGLSQSKRMSNIKVFNGSKMSVLVCTDVASRGLHIDNISHVYNYDLPDDPKDYVHRIGRTARAGEDGKVINLISRNDHALFSNIMKKYSFFIKKIETPVLKKTIFVREKHSQPTRFRRDDRRNTRGSPRNGSGFSRGRSSSGFSRGRSSAGPPRSRSSAGPPRSRSSAGPPRSRSSSGPPRSRSSSGPESYPKRKPSTEKDSSKPITKKGSKGKHSPLVKKRWKRD